MEARNPFQVFRSGSAGLRRCRKNTTRKQQKQLLWIYCMSYNKHTDCGWYNPLVKFIYTWKARRILSRVFCPGFWLPNHNVCLWNTLQLLSHNRITTLQLLFPYWMSTVTSPISCSRVIYPILVSSTSVTGWQTKSQLSLADKSVQETLQNSDYLQWRKIYMGKTIT